MNTDQALAFLNMHQPIPSTYELVGDDSIDEGDLLDQLDAVIEHFRTHRDSRCVRPLFFAVGSAPEYDQFRHIINLLADYPKEDVMPVVLEGLRHPDVDYQHNALWLASYVGDDRLRNSVQEKLFAPQNTMRSAAAMAYANFVGEQDRDWLEDALEKARNDQERLERLLNLLDDKRGGKAR